jgi:tRNA(adenine34) deaminase
MEESMNPEFFMEKALEEAKKALELGEMPIGAVVVLDGEILAIDHTQEIAQKRMLVHAELLALETADKIIAGFGKRRSVQLYTTLEPCLMCFGAAMSFFLGEIYYALESPGDGAVELVQNWQKADGDFPSYQVPKIFGNIMRQESINLFRDYAERYPNKGEMTLMAKKLSEL